MIESLSRLFRYDVWANQETLASLDHGTPPPKSMRWMAHIVGAEHIWLARLCRRQARLPVWPDLDLEACREELNQLSAQWREYLSALTSARLGNSVPYVNSKGESWSSTVEQILTHVTIHSAYHRGQIASDVRSSGSEPAYTDYIHAVRQRLIE